MASIDPTAATERFFLGASAAGLRRVLICPGSRSAPLAIGAARSSGIPFAVHLDERTAAFAALGEAKASGEPVAVICTSGTAGANFAPAIAEASMSNVPLIAVTADRPPEHQHWGVGQSLDQRGLFAPHVRTEYTMPVGGDAGSGFYERAGWRAAATAIEAGGPVHVNWAFRLPLEPVGADTSPVTALPRTTRTLPRDEQELDRFADALRSAQAPVLIAGPSTVHPNEPDRASSILQSADQLNIAVLADVLSGLRGHGPQVSMPSYAGRTPGPADLIIRFGHTPTAKSTRLWWETCTDAGHVLLDPHNDWQDPSHLLTDRLTSDPEWLLSRTAELLAAPTAARRHVSDWHERGQRVEHAIGTLLDGYSAFTEAHIARTVGRWAGEVPGRVVVSSSSMPVRDLDDFSPVTTSAPMLANRGVNGIDGVIATAIGVSRAVDSRVTVLVGDIAALHDIGSVLDAARQAIPLTIVIPNNDGGGIFSNLPVRDAIEPAMFDQLFHTPHGTDFSFLDGVENASYTAVSSADALHAELQPPSDVAVAVVEARVDTGERMSLRDDIHQALLAL